MLKKVAMITSAAMLSLTLVACGSEPATDTSAAQADAAATENAAAKSEAETTGTKKEEAVSEPVAATAIGVTSPDAIKVKVTNDLGMDITEFVMRKSGETEWGENLLKENEVIKNAGVVELGIAADDATENYDLKLADANGTSVEIAQLALSTLSEATLHQSEGVGYATFFDVNGNEGSTKAADPADAGQDLAAPQDSVEEDYAEPTYEDTYTEPSYAEPAYTEESYEAPAYEEPYSEPVADVAPEQSADDCTRDNIILDVE